MIGQYHPLLVALSILVAGAASYTALGLAERMTHTRGAAASWWLAGGSIAMGVGIWAMHFIGMLAFSLPIPIVYDGALTALSLVVAIVVSALALSVVARPVVSGRRMAASATLMAGGVSAMHYVGMGAIEVAPAITYDPALLVASIAIALVASFVALRILCALNRPAASTAATAVATGGAATTTAAGKSDAAQATRPLRLRLLAACVMGAAISGMHFTGMAAAHFHPDSVCLTDEGALDQFWLAMAIGGGTIALLAITTITSILTAHLDSRTAQMNDTLRRANAELARLVTHDALTGLPNRQLLDSRIADAVAKARREGRRLAVMFVDLDRFKVVNDSAGHHVGDELLREVALRIGGRLRRPDTLSRIGGDEFAVLLEPIDHPRDAAEIAARIREALATTIRIPPHDLHVSASIGISLYPDDGATADELLTHADAAMYHAKQAGRATFAFYAPEMNVFTQERLEIESALHNALEAGQFELHYQPKVDISSGKVESLEALLRWNHPTRGRINPASFIPIAEESGLIGPIGEWVLRTACRQSRAWQAEGLPPMRIAVNLSARQFRQSNLLATVRDILEETNLPAHLLELELTESTVMGDPEESVRTLEALSRMGVHIAVDDFGTGYSSLAYLQRLPLKVLKVDRSFVKDLAHNPQDASIVQSVISMAHSLGLKVIAEGVETGPQLDLLRSLGCDHFQGFLYSTPVSAEEARRFMVAPREAEVKQTVATAD
jgi:diguanylate cyclase (GGDEF)-like protein